MVNNPKSQPQSNIKSQEIGYQIASNDNPSNQQNVNLIQYTQNSLDQAQPQENNPQQEAKQPIQP